MRIGKALTRVAAIILSVGLLATLVGCGDSKPTESPLPPPSSPLSVPSQFESPAMLPTQVPATHVPEIPGPTLIPGPTFAIDRPLKAGTTRITGQGPAGIPIVVVDVTLTGKELGQGFIDNTGHFDIKLSQPLEYNHRIGLMAGTTHLMSADEAQVYITQLYRWKGEGARNLPYIGVLFDTAMVEQ